MKNSSKNEKLEIAYKKVKEDIAHYYTSDSPKDRMDDPRREEILFTCPQCGHETFLLSGVKEDIFECKNCAYEEQGGYCSITRVCNGNLIPEHFLTIWDEETGAMICDECDESFKQISD